MASPAAEGLHEDARETRDRRARAACEHLAARSAFFSRCARSWQSFDCATRDALRWPVRVGDADNADSSASQSLYSQGTSIWMSSRKGERGFCVAIQSSTSSMTLCSLST
eukprot:2402675-Prymnesium_polylepis.1